MANSAMLQNEYEKAEGYLNRASLLGIENRNLSDAKAALIAYNKKSLNTVTVKKPKGQPKPLEVLNTLPVAQTELQAAEYTHLQSWLNDADQYLQAGQLVAPFGANAYENYFKALSREPDNKRAQAGVTTIKEQIIAKAETAQAQQEWDVARGYLQTLLQVAPQSERAREALASMTSAKAESQVQSITRTQIQTWLAEANKYMQLGQLSRPIGANALEILQQVLDQEPNHAQALAGMATLKDKLYEKAMAAKQQGNLELASSQIWTLLRIDSNSRRARETLAAISKEKFANKSAAISKSPESLQPEIDQDLFRLLNKSGAKKISTEVTE